MSKRTRGSQRQAGRRPGARPATARPSGTARQPLSQSRPETAGSVELQVGQPTVEPARSQPAPVAAATRSTHARVRAKPGSLLAARAATEYVYVSQDLRRIAVVAIGLFVLLVVLWVVLVVLGVSPLY